MFTLICSPAELVAQVPNGHEDHRLDAGGPPPAHQNRSCATNSKNAERWRCIGRRTAFMATGKSYRRVTGYDHRWMLTAHLDCGDKDVAETQKAFLPTFYCRPDTLVRFSRSGNSFDLPRIVRPVVLFSTSSPPSSSPGYYLLRLCRLVGGSLGGYGS